MESGRIVLLVTSPRLPAGLLSAPAWDLVRACPVFCAQPTDATDALRLAGASVTMITPTAAQLLERLAEQATAVQPGTEPATIVWLAGPDGDPDLARDLGLRIARQPGLAELELMYGSWDPPGARLLDAVQVMDRLVSPGGDPWKHQQTHQSLARYLLEEAYEAYDAIEADDHRAMLEELGDVLLQVILHARLAESADPPWTIDDVAGSLVDKLVRRNPHVFGDVTVSGVAEILENWERIKKAEKQGRSIMDGIALSQPALALAGKVLARAGADGADLDGEPQSLADEEQLAAAMFGLVAAAQARGWDAEAVLRRAVLRRMDAIRAAEAG